VQQDCMTTLAGCGFGRKPSKNHFGSDLVTSAEGWLEWVGLIEVWFIRYNILCYFRVVILN